MEERTSQPGKDNSAIVKARSSLPCPEPLSLSTAHLSRDGGFGRILEFKKRELFGLLGPDILQTAAELHASSVVLGQLDPSNTVVVFGSARVPASTSTAFLRGDEADPYKNAMETCRRLGLMGFSIITGGGPGIMEAANRGAILAMEQTPGLVIHSVGCNIKLPNEQKPNSFQSLSLEFEKLAPRKEAMIRHSGAVLLYPGGFGTLDELGEVLALVQTGKIKELSSSARYNPYPVILVGKEYWSPFGKWVEETLAGKFKAITPAGAKVINIVETPQEAAAILKGWKEQGAGKAEKRLSQGSTLVQ